MSEDELEYERGWLSAQAWSVFLPIERKDEDSAWARGWNAYAAYWAGAEAPHA